MVQIVESLSGDKDIVAGISDKLFNLNFVTRLLNNKFVNLLRI